MRLFYFIFFNDCLVKHFDILFNLKKKIELIWWDKFRCNFKYIFINEIGFIKKIVLIVGQINKKLSFIRWGLGEKVFPVMRGEVGMRQDKTMWDGDEDSILWSRPHWHP